jgi:NAD(P)-dependent dehydrogenase (short-subunit alcohol dehydrogenase family)
MRLEQKVAVITGAGRGIGRAIARCFAAEGAAVVVAEINPTSGQDVVDLIRARDQEAYLYECDVTDVEQVQAMVEFALGELGHVDILVNNAVWEGDWMHGDAWRAVEVGLGGTWNCSRAILPPMAEQGHGSVINMSSVQALMGFGVDHLYTATKGAIVSLTRAMACEYGKHNVRINVICPGSIRTEHWDKRNEANPGVIDSNLALYPLGRVGEPCEVADAALYLASEESSFVTGSVLVVDGGITAGHIMFQEM